MKVLSMCSLATIYWVVSNGMTGVGLRLGWCYGSLPSYIQALSSCELAFLVDLTVESVSYFRWVAWRPRTLSWTSLVSYHFLLSLLEETVECWWGNWSYCVLATSHDVVECYLPEKSHSRLCFKNLSASLENAGKLLFPCYLTVSHGEITNTAALFSSKPDVYVEVNIDGQASRRTEIIRKNASPKWEEIFTV